MSELVGKTLELLAENKDGFVSAVKNIFNTKTMATLKISDLSVGDWVYHDDIVFGREIAKVHRLNKNEYGETIGITVYRSDCVVGIVSTSPTYNDIHPIPITAEMLEANGWSNDGMYARLRIDEQLHLEYYYHEHRLRKWYCGIDEWENHVKVNDITFQAHCYSVHQLQHALRLAGVDKEINL